MMHQLTPFQLAAQQAAAVAMLGAAAAFMWQPEAAAGVYAAGALVYCPTRMLQRYEGGSFVIRRLRRQQLLAQAAFLCTACCMIMQAFAFGFARRQEWVVCLTIACVLELYTTLRISAELKKEQT